MFLSAHAAAGIFIASKFTSPWAVFGLSFVSHFVLDFIPHGDDKIYHDEEWRVQKRYRRVLYYGLIDLGVLTGMTLFSYQHTPLADTGLMLLGILGSILPDFLSLLFPVIHERMSWLWLVRWVYKLTKPTGLRYIYRVQYWIHEVVRPAVVQKDLPFRYGLALQVATTLLFLYFTPR